MNHHPRRFRASAIAALIALATVAADQAIAGPTKPHQHAQSASPHHNAVNNNVQHQQHQQAQMQQHYQQQQALIQQQYQHQQALIQQHQQHQQALAQQRQQALANRKATANSSVSAKGTATGTTNPIVAGSPTTGPIAGLTNPRFSSRRQYSPYSTGGSRNTNNSRQNHQLVSELHSTRNMLQQDDHDYNGHRARAVHEIGQAIHALSGQSHRSSFASNRANTGTGNRTGINNTGNNGQNRMPQAQSDQNLRQAHQSLMNIQSQMTSNGGSSQHQRAHQHVQQAARELTVALNVR